MNSILKKQAMKLLNDWIFMYYYNNDIVRYILSMAIVFKYALRLAIKP